MIIQYIYRIFLILFSYYFYVKIEKYNNITKNLFFLMFCSNIVTILHYMFYIEINLLSFLISFIVTKYVLFNPFQWKKHNISHPLNEENVFLALYKAKNIDMSLRAMTGFPIYSICLVLFLKDKYTIFLFKKKEEKMQKIRLSKEKMEQYLTGDYLVMRTNFKTKDLKGDWERVILDKKRITLKGFWRLNCLSSIKIVLNQIPGMKVRFYEFFPSMYIKRIIKKKKLDLYVR